MLTKASRRELPENSDTMSQVDILQQPNSSQAYLMFCRFDNEDLWMVDGYRWYDNSFKTNKDGVRVHNYCIATPPDDSKSSKKAGFSTEFRKVVFTFSNIHRMKGSPVIIWYKGNQTIASHFPHGNAKTPRLYLSTAKSTIEDIKNKLDSHQSNEVQVCQARTKPEMASNIFYFFKYLI